MNTNADMIALLKQQKFLDCLPQEYYALIADCSELKGFKEGAVLLKQNHHADVFFLILEGRVGLSAHLPAQGAMPIETLSAPATLGWSWLIAPYKWRFEAKALTDVSTVLVHTPCIIGKIEQDKVFGYEMYKRFIEVVVDRLQGTRLQMMDVYAKPEPPPL